MHVSVIIPTYNRAAYLLEALESIFGQTMAPSETIVIDDGSTDNTEDVVRHYSGTIQYYQQEHKGVASARNLGLHLATGELIAWLDSDDLWEPDFLATIVPRIAEDERLDGVYTGITMIDAGGARIGTATRIEPAEKLYDALIRDNFLATPTIVMRKTCYDQVGGFDSQFNIAEDSDMWLRLADRFRIEGIPKPLARIRIHETNTMSDVDTFCRSRLALTRKHFGILNDSCVMADTSKSAYAYAFRSVGLKYIECGQPKRGWFYLKEAAELHPAILQRLDTFYELACGDQPRGYRGQADLLDIDQNGIEMLRRLDDLLDQALPETQAMRRVAFGNAYLALAMLSDQAGDWVAARRYLVRAAQNNPELLSRSFLRRFAKIFVGKRAAGMLKAYSNRVEPS